MRANRVEEASALGTKIGTQIIKRNSIYLKQEGSKFNSKDMGAKVHQLSNRTQPQTNSSLSAAELNNHFASISQDPQYISPLCRLTVTKPTQFVSEAEIFYLLDHLKPTAMGLDNLPS